mgnify:FL=1
MPPIRQYLTKHVWTIIDGKVEQILHRVTLQDLLNLAQGKDEV